MSVLTVIRPRRRGAALLAAGVAFAAVANQRVSWLSEKPAVGR